MPADGPERPDVPALVCTRTTLSIDDDVLAAALEPAREGTLLCRSLRSAEPIRTQLRVLRQLVAALLA